MRCGKLESLSIEARNGNFGFHAKVIISTKVDRRTTGSVIHLALIVKVPYFEIMCLEEKNWNWP